MDIVDIWTEKLIKKSFDSMFKTNDSHTIISNAFFSGKSIIFKRNECKKDESKSLNLPVVHEYLINKQIFIISSSFPSLFSAFSLYLVS